MSSAATTAGVHGTGSMRPSRPHHKRRAILVAALALFAVVLLLAAVKGTQIFELVSFGKHAQKMGPPPEAVSTFVAQEQTWEETIPSVGSVSSTRGVSISNDSPGIVTRIAFESGDTVKQGQVLVELDTRVESAQLASAKARMELAKTNAERTRKLAASGAVTNAQLENDESQLAAASADVNALAAQIERKVVRAPFGGKLGIRLVNVGQYLAPGTKITDLESEQGTYVDFALPQQDLASIAVGMPVRISASHVEQGSDAGATAPPTIAGSIYAIDPTVDPATRNIRVRASVEGAEKTLRPGMFVDVQIVEPKKAQVVAVPETAIVHASYGDSVFVVEDEKDTSGAVVHAPDDSVSKIVRQQFVRRGDARGDFVAVVDGLSAGAEVVSEGAFKLRNRARVAVKNDVQPKPQLEPHPPNR